jgi:hypothetical protein
VVPGYNKNPETQCVADDAIAKRGLATDVDPTALDGCPPCLEGLRSYAEERLILDMAKLSVPEGATAGHSNP